MPRIVCIDPDASRAERPVQVLRSAGYEVMMACSPEVGLALVHLFPPDVVLLHCDLAEQLEPKIHLVRPAVPVVLTGDKPVSAENLRWLTAHRSPGAAAQNHRHLSH